MSPHPKFRIFADVVCLPSDDGSLVLYDPVAARPWPRVVESETRIIMTDEEVVGVVNTLLNDLARELGPLLFQAIRDVQGAGAIPGPGEVPQ